MKIKVNFSKRHFIGIIFLMLILSGTFFVVSYGGNDPSYAGHTMNEIEGLNLESFCTFSHNATRCPSGWHREGIYDGHTLRGSDFPIGGTGGAESHTHHVGGLKKCSGISTWVGSDGSTGGASSWPPYVNVLICCKD